ncbi:Clp protease N-terminal domain-containing protein [Actinomycetospora chiangmaiensis]|uniref:Clp protease N-terminal domain-containing protein n=1 Tax=Actinomycetospora chiangmaiensis TaxID=402650 RepID=UPI0003800C68|nr:Clp protease N-terminal domain-containing protein [Actinomycetospora chiangmaiensis]
MTVTPIFDDLAASWVPTPEPAAAAPVRVAADPRRRPSPRPRSAGSTSVVGTAAFGRGCLEAAVEEHGADDDEVTRLLEGARREAVALGRRWVDSVHLLLAAIRAGGDVGRAFGLRGAGPAVLLAALDDDRSDVPDELAGGDPVRPALSSVARTVLHRVAHRAARADRAVTAAELAVAVVRTGRVADLLGRLGVDVDDLVDALEVSALESSARADTAPAGTRADRAGWTAAPVAPTVVDGPRRRVSLPVGVLAPLTVMLPAAPVEDDRAADVPA